LPQLSADFAFEARERTIRGRLIVRRMETARTRPVRRPEANNTYSAMRLSIDSAGEFSFLNETI
jgi:hypothetical protein